MGSAQSKASCMSCSVVMPKMLWMSLMKSEYPFGPPFTVTWCTCNNPTQSLAQSFGGCWPRFIGSWQEGSLLKSESCREVQGPLYHLPIKGHAHGGGCLCNLLGGWSQDWLPVRQLCLTESARCLLPAIQDWLFRNPSQLPWLMLQRCTCNTDIT